ncbi:hypothetical protein B0H16DRAFT_1725984 [Mycena metata]|uniref:Bacteriophage T5 Orf172 DNA-binding domain-containing protein n=1 Tax=Mycena metata TaxID=1033252 RepID=A0AAD7IPS3_9AGAR|nr:hypothetical protein B0H16DRAFT_1725984 [Mycena metata]
MALRQAEDMAIKFGFDERLRNLHSLLSTITPYLMAPGRTLKFFIRAFESHDHARIADLSDPYDDGPGFNYLVRRRRRTDIDALNLGVITQAQLDARTEYKWGETERPITKRQREYRRCEAMYEIVWIRIYSTPVRKLSEGLVHAEFRIAGLQAPDVLCSCGTNHREWFLLDPMEGDTAAALEYVFVRWMALLGHPDWEEEDL